MEQQISLKAGAGSSEIQFPETILPLEGFCKIHDLPRTGVLILEERIKIAIVSVEIVMLPEDLLSACKKTVAEIAELEEKQVWIHMTHAISTPHAPGGPLLGLGGDEAARQPSEEGIFDDSAKRRCYYMTIKASVERAAKQAAGSLREARLGIAVGECGLIQNRDIRTPAGWWIGINGEGPSNRELNILTVRNLQGSMIGCLLSYAMKPCTLDNSWMDVGKRQISADTPGRACRILEKRLRAPVLYCMSAAADQVPAKTVWYDAVDERGAVTTIDLGVEKGLEFVEELGREMADIVETVICSREQHLENTAISMSHSYFAWQTKAKSPMKPRVFASFEAEGRAEVPVELITIGDVALVGTGPEINMITEKQLKEGSPYSHTLLVSMVNGGMKYMPDLASYEEFRWEAAASMLMPGAAEEFVRRALKLCSEKKG